MPYEYLEEGVTADVSFRAVAADLDGLFATAADATTNVMVDDLDSVRPLLTRAVEVNAEALDLLLFRFLGEILFYKDAEALLTRARRVAVETTAGGYRLRAELCGERIDPARHRLAADAKGVTLHDLRVARDGAGWSATVTLDV